MTHRQPDDALAEATTYKTLKRARHALARRVLQRLIMQTQPRRRSRRVSSKLPVCWLRRGKEVPALVADINLHGMFIRTELEAWRDELLEVVVQLGDGPLRMCVVARFMGDTDSGRGIGAELFLVSKHDRRRWSQHYHATLRKVTGGAGRVQTFEAVV